MMDKLKLCQKGNYHHNGNPKHGLFRGNEELFNVWHTMKSRCENQKRGNYGRYGGRGIEVCDEWHIAENFVKWAIKNGYRRGLQLDRINNDGNYNPDNCRWVTPKQNSRNTRRNQFLTIHGETKCVSEWCETIPTSQYTIYWWIREKGKEYAEQRLSEIA
jgi:hypothetical protein